MDEKLQLAMDYLAKLKGNLDKGIVHEKKRKECRS